MPFPGNEWTYNVRLVTANRPLLGMMTAAILAIVALFLPGVAGAHAGHHGPALSSAGAVVPAAHHELIAIGDAADMDIDFGFPADAFLSRADATPASGAGTCHAPCCCMTGGAGCTSPALGPPSILALPPEFGHAAFEAPRVAALPDALRQRLRKPPRA